jgi:hypothetical protein
MIVSALLQLHKIVQAFTVMYFSLHQRLADPQTFYYNQIKEVEIERVSNTQRRYKCMQSLVRKPERQELLGIF